MESQHKGKIFILLDLPAEVIDRILAYIPLHRDLLNFALTSRLCSSLAIPRHTEYRVVHLDDDIDPIWTHLARRADLACNIREIHVIYDEAPSEFDPGPSCYFPVALVDPELDVQIGRQMVDMHEDMLKALSCMVWLEKIHFNYIPSRSRHVVPKLFEVLKTLPMLKHISLHHPKRFSTKILLENHPIWSMSSLLSLCLEGDGWYYLSERDIGHYLFLKWLQSLSSLQVLRMEVDAFLQFCDDISFPNLQGLDLQSDTDFYSKITDFLLRHPTIEEVILPLRRLPEVPDNLLPNLKSLACVPPVVLDLEAAYLKNKGHTSNSLWQLEYLHIPDAWWGFDEYDEKTFVDQLSTLTCIDPSTLRILSLSTSGSVSSFIKLAKAFAMIEELEIPGIMRREANKGSSSNGFQDILLVYSHFKNLRVAHGDSTWLQLSEDVPEELELLSPDQRAERFSPSPMDPKTSFALYACQDPRRIQLEEFSHENHDWTPTMEVNHRILTLAKRCKKLERIGSHIAYDEIIFIRRKKVDWKKVKVMVDWLGIAKEKVEAKWEEIEYSIEVQRSRDPFDTMPRTYGDGI